MQNATFRSDASPANRWLSTRDRQIVAIARRCARDLH
jgi:hypothetical protein